MHNSNYIIPIKYRITISCFLIFLFCLPSCNSQSTNENFDLVIKNTTNSELKERLLNFQKDGIEKNSSQYDINKVISYANSFKNTPHKMGGTSLKGIDCSGLVYITHKEFGINLPRSSQEQARFGKIIPTFKELRKGDLVFYNNSYKTSNFITHVGIYIGDGNFIHTSNKKGVIISKVNDPYYWGERFLFGTRFTE